MGIGEIAIGAEYRINEQFQNLLIFGIFIVFEIEKALEFTHLSLC